MKTQVQCSAVYHEPGYEFDIHIRKVRWLPLFVEQWLVPRFIIKITNKGKNIERGELDCEFLEYDEISSFPSVKSNFKDFQHFPIEDFKKGDVLKCNSKIESRFIKPGRYMIRLLIIRKREPPGSPYEELFSKLKREYPHDDKKIERMILQIERISPIPGKTSPGEFRGVPLIDWRWLEVMKVHSVSTFAALVACLVALVGSLAALIAYLAGLIGK